MSLFGNDEPDDGRINRSMWPIEYRKPHDVSFDKNKSLMRTQLTQGMGEDARDGSEVVMHFTVHAPDEDGGEVLVFDSLKKAPRGVRFTLGETLHAEAARDLVLGIEAPKLGPKATEKIVLMQRKVFGEKARAWKPPETMTRWNVRLDSATAGVVLAFVTCPPERLDSYSHTPPLPPHTMDEYVYHSKLSQVPAFVTYPPERLAWSSRQKNFGTVLFQRGYKKAMLDLEIPTQWTEETNIERNRLRVKALFRRACANLNKPVNINGLESALADLMRAREIEPENKEVAQKLSEARGRQKALDREQTSVYTKMVQTDAELYPDAKV